MQKETEAAELALEDLIQPGNRTGPERSPYPTVNLFGPPVFSRRGGRVRRGRAAARPDRGRGQRQGAAGGGRERPAPPPPRVGQPAPLQGGRGVRDALPAGRARHPAGDDPDDRGRGNGRRPAGHRRVVPARPEVRAAYDLGRARPHGEAPLVRAPRTAGDLREPQGRHIRGLHLPLGLGYALAREVGLEVITCGTYLTHLERDFLFHAHTFTEGAFVEEDPEAVAARIEAAEPDLIIGTHLEEGVAESLEVPFLPLCPPPPTGPSSSDR